MTDINTGENSSKKKFLIPLLALLLCGVSLMGTAYAYNSSLNTEADLNVHSYEITVGGTTTIAFKQPLTYDSYINKDGVAKYTLNDFSDSLTVSMKNGQGARDFKITNVVLECSAPGADFKYSVDGKTITLTATALKDDDGRTVLVDKPAASYKVSITIITEAVEPATVELP